MSDTERFNQIWNTLTDNQRRFILAMTRYNTKREAALSLGLRPNTVYRWPPEIDEAIALLLADILSVVRDELRAAAARAVYIKTDGLDNEDPRLRQQTATEILDRVLGKARPLSPDVPIDDQLEVNVSFEELPPIHDDTP